MEPMVEPEDNGGMKWLSSWNAEKVWRMDGRTTGGNDSCRSP